MAARNARPGRQDAQGRSRSRRTGRTCRSASWFRSRVPKDEYVVAYEFRPSDPRVVHHALFYTDGSGVARQKQAQSEADGHTVGYASFGGPGFLPTSVLGAWVPGTTAAAAAGRASPSRCYHDSDIVIQTHFHPTGKVETEQSTLGHLFRQDAAQETGERHPDGGLRAEHPARREGLRRPRLVRRTLSAVQAISIQPHAHLLCKEMKVTATLPRWRRQTADLDQGLGLELARRLSVRSARAAAGGDAGGHGLHLRQFHRQSA